MRTLRLVVAAWVLLAACASVALGEGQRVRVASYNIKFFKTSVQDQGDRLDKLKRVVQLLDADVIGLQEIDDRAALELLFPPASWTILIDDDSGDDQDVAIVVRKPLKVLGYNQDLDADDANFVFSGPQNNSGFPNRRDLLFAEVRDERDAQSPVSFTVMVHHAKARFGGRHITDPRREAAAEAIMRVIEQRFDDGNVILLGDMNDAPDDRSLNILETGDPAAPGGPEEIDGPFMVNLMEPLWAAGHVSYGRRAADEHPSRPGRINTVDLGARQRNNNARGTNANTGDILFDQILVPTHMAAAYVLDSAAVFDHLVALEGSGDNVASDHLPVFADFAFGGDATDGPPPAPPGLRIASLLPNPDGQDAGNEQVTIANTGGQAVDLAGWMIRDRAGTQLRLQGQVPASDKTTITLPAYTVALANSGDDVHLINPQGQAVHHVRYTASKARSGVVVEFQ